MCAFQGAIIIGCKRNHSKSIAVIDFLVSHFRLAQWVALLAHSSNVLGSMLSLGSLILHVAVPTGFSPYHIGLWQALSICSLFGNRMTITDLDVDRYLHSTSLLLITTLNSVLRKLASVFLSRLHLTAGMVHPLSCLTVMWRICHASLFGCFAEECRKNTFFFPSYSPVSLKLKSSNSLLIINVFYNRYAWWDHLPSLLQGTNFLHTLGGYAVDFRVWLRAEEH